MTRRILVDYCVDLMTEVFGIVDDDNVLVIGNVVDGELPIGVVKLGLPQLDYETFDVRKHIYEKYYYIFFGKIIPNKFINLRSNNGHVLVNILADKEKKILSLLPAPTGDNCLFFESFTDSKDCYGEHDSLAINVSLDPGELCAVIPRTATIADVLEQISAGLKTEGNWFVTKSANSFPMLVSTRSLPRFIRRCPSNLIHNAHYSIDSPKDATTCRDGYDYYHYGVDGYKDIGWGCAYRSIQTLISWYLHNGYGCVDVPTVEGIQKILRKSDFAHEYLVIGSKTWIGCVEASTVLREVCGVDCRILHAKDVEELASLIVGPLREHFKEVGTPVMIGAGNYAYTIAGVAKEEEKVLVLDPHCTDAKGLIEWKDIRKFFDFNTVKGTFVNICSPST